MDKIRIEWTEHKWKRGPFGKGTVFIYQAKPTVLCCTNKNLRDNIIQCLKLITEIRTGSSGKTTRGNFLKRFYLLQRTLVNVLHMSRSIRVTPASVFCDLHYPLYRIHFVCPKITNHFWLKKMNWCFSFSSL